MSVCTRGAGATEEPVRGKGLVMRAIVKLDGADNTV